MDINTRTQDYIDGKIIEVPNYQEWMTSHSFPEFEKGERFDWSDKLQEKFNELKKVDRIYIDGLPVTSMSLTNKGNIYLDYYHHTEDNLYPLGVAYTGMIVEDLESLSSEQFNKIIKNNLVLASEIFAKLNDNNNSRK